MENASKALLIAGGILIGLIIISMGVYLYRNAAEIPKNYDKKLKNQKIEIFNAQFLKYENENISAQDIITVVNLAVENNRIYEEEDSGYFLKVYLNDKIINDFTETQKIKLMEKTTADNFLAYKCSRS